MSARGSLGPRVKLRSVCSIVAGQSPSSSAYNGDGNGLPFYQGKKEFTDRYLAAPSVWTTETTKRALSGDIVMSVRAPVGPVNEVLEDICIGRGLAAIRAGDGIERGFLWYALLWMQPRITGSDGAVFPSISRAQIEELEIPLPPTNEQKLIVAALDQAFAALDRARANAEINLQDARQLRSQSIEDLLSDPELGGLEPCGDHIELLTGFAFSSSRYTESDDDIRLVRGDNIVQGAFRWNGVKRWPASERATYQKFELARDDVLIAMDRTWVSAGIKYAVVDDDALPSLLVQRVARLRAKPSIDPRYLAAWIGSPMFERYVLSIQTGLGVPHVSGGQLEHFPIRVPSLDVQSRVIDRLARLSESCERLQAHYQRSTEDIATLRQSLLQAAFSGQLS